MSYYGGYGSYSSYSSGGFYSTYWEEEQKRKRRERHTFEETQTTADDPMNTSSPQNDDQATAQDDDSNADSAQHNTKSVASLIGGSPSLINMAAFIPLRMNEEERQLLSILEASLHVSEYTDKVDVLTYRVSKFDRIMKELEDFFRIFSGLCCAVDFRTGAKMIKSRTFKDNSDLIARLCEVGRRNKIMNPDKMRTTYGKLMWLLQDSVSTNVERELGFSFVTRVQTAGDLLKDKEQTDLLADPNLEIATEPMPFGLTSARAMELASQKETALKELIAKYKSDSFMEEEVCRVVFSLADYRSFLMINQAPVDRMIEYLHQFFSPTSDSKGSLAISSGHNGSCITHSHRQQFVFVLQSLLLWREIMGEMYRLWLYADADLLEPSNPYRLRDTGQGLNRMQSCPNVGSAMHKILSRVQSRVGAWVGLSVVHLGDRDVPNALVFIDKYTQVPRILAPIVSVISQIERIAREPNVGKMIQQHFGGVAELQREILGDFFRHGFDGSGDDGGSCIDGRLTSAWNWCSLLEKKRYYHIFLMTGFTGFDGDTG